MSFPNTVVRLLKDVPLSSSYEHTRDFSSKENQTRYFLDKSAHTFTDFTYQREEQSIKVPIQIDKLYDVNYVMYQNSDYSSKWFYGFVVRKEYVNPNTTAIYFQIDVFQSWLFDFKLKPSYVVREHTKRWNADGSPVINTVPEDLNYGTDYNTVYSKQVTPYEDVLFLVIVSKQPLHTGETGTIKPVMNATPTPLNYYIHPFRKNGATPGATISGTNINLSPVNDVLTGIYKSETAVNNVVSLYITEYPGIDLTYSNGVVTFPTAHFEHRTIQDDTNSFNTVYLKSAINYTKHLQSLGNKYDGYEDVTESKLLMYPYTVLVLDDFKGNRMEFKNEYINSQNLIMSIFGSIGTNNKVAYTFEDYNQENLSGTDLQRRSLENALISQNPNDVPIITDLLSAFIQGNRNTLENQQNQILFTGLSSVFSSLASGIGSASLTRQLGGTGMSAIPGAITGMGESLVNTYFSIQSINAKTQDIDNTPPSISSMGANTNFSFGNGYSGVYVLKKQIKPEYRKRLSDFFKMFGYKVNELKTPNLKSREHFNYIQTQSIAMSGNIPTDQLQELKSIFNNGVTIWHTDDIGNYSLSNGEV